MKKHIAEDYRVIVWPETRYSARDDKVIAEDIVNQIKHHVDDFRQVYIECTEKDICSFCESGWEVGGDGCPLCCNKAVEEWDAAQKKERP